MILDPRQDFRTSSIAKGWSDLMISTQFSVAAQAAIIELERSFPKAEDEASAAANHWRRDGANRFLYILMNLAETAPPIEAKGLSSNLKHHQ